MSEDRPPTEVDITVAGHSVSIRCHDPLAVAADKALELFRATEVEARRSIVGFSANGASTERAAMEVEYSPDSGLR